MPYPYAERSKILTEVGDARQHFLDRLKRLGAGDDVIAAVAEHWHEGDPAERDAFVARSDADLRIALKQLEDEHAVETMTEPEQADVEAAAILGHIEAAQAKVSEPVASVREWIGDNRAKAVAAWVAEHDAATTPRVTLLDHIESMAGDWLDRAGFGAEPDEDAS